MSTPKKLKRLLSDKVIAQIRTMIANVLAHPEDYDQANFPDRVFAEAKPTLLQLVKDGRPVNGLDPIRTHGDKGVGPACGTAMCAAGHLVFARSKRKYVENVLKDRQPDWEQVALAELGKPFNDFLEDLDNKGKGSWHSIFGDQYGWPDKFSRMYEKASVLKTKKARNAGRAKAFAARWEAFIASDGRDVEWGYYDKK